MEHDGAAPRFYPSGRRPVAHPVHDLSGEIRLLLEIPCGVLRPCRQSEWRGIRSYFAQQFELARVFVGAIRPNLTQPSAIFRSAL